MARLFNSRIVRIKELCERLEVSRVTIWRWERKGLLPPSRRLGPNVVGWLESEIEEWFASTASPEPEGSEAAAASGEG